MCRPIERAAKIATLPYGNAACSKNTDFDRVATTPSFYPPHRHGKNENCGVTAANTNLKFYLNTKM